MKIIPSDVQCLISASNQINNYDKAVEELVYNAIDAGATSVAIRINVQENTIQVIDNGCGIFQNDFNLIGQKYTTSKFIDLSTLQSAPNKYGFRGQSLFSLINVSKNVIMTSRHVDSGETWMKIFEYGKEKQIKICNTRPSKGTTVEVHGLFYNLKIQKKIKNILSNLHSIKIFLEHMSLVHSNISLSLRDDSKNEIIFKMHKNRDMYQTLSALYNIKKEDCQEMRVEKNEYKVTAFIGNCDNEIERHFIFLNGKFVTNTSKLHKIVNNNLIKHFKMGDIKNPKAKNVNKDEEIHVFQKRIPYYFIFIKCPYTDYDLSNSAKQSVLEFKDWNQVIKLLDKLIKFFNGDLNIKEVNKVERKIMSHKPEEIDTRKQVKKIMENILGTHSKKQGTFYMYNGIKGKQVKRKVMIPLEKNVPKVLNSNENNDQIFMISFESKGKNKKISGSCLNKQKESKKKATKSCSKSNFTKSFMGSIIGKTYNTKLKKVLENKELFGNKTQPRMKHLAKKKSCMCKDKLMKKFEMETDSVKKRCDELDERVTNKLNHLHKRQCEFFGHENIQFKNINKNIVNVSVRKQIDEIIIHDYIPKPIQYKLPNNNNVCNNVKRKEFQSNYDLVQTILNSQNDSSNVHQQNEGATNSLTIVSHSETIAQRQPRISTCEAYTFKDKEAEYHSVEPIVTFQSHNYYAHRNVNTENNLYHTSHYCDLQTEYNTTDYHRVYKKPRTFISKQSRDNFKIPNSTHQYKILKKKNNKTCFDKQFKSSIKRLLNQTHKLFNLRKQIMQNIGDSSHTIEFTASNSNSHKITDGKDINVNKSPVNLCMNTGRKWKQSFNYNYSVHNNDHITINTNTYTISSIDDNGYTKHDDNWNTYHTYIVEQTNESEAPNEVIGFDYNCSNKNYIFISKSQENEQNEDILDPINMCETILHSQDKETNKEFEFISNDRQNNLSKDFIDNTLFQEIVDNSLCDNFHTYVNEQNKELGNDQQPNLGENPHTHDSLKEFSHHFSGLPNNNVKISCANNFDELRNQSPILTSMVKNLQEKTTEKQLIQEVADGKNMMNPDNFNLKNRLCFLPKGMSPIFENCQSKNICEYNLSGDYYENGMYNNFVDNVRNNAELFEPKIQGTKEHTTKAIDKVNSKLHKDSSSLKFNGESLKGAKILGQIDEKFIAAIMKGKCNKKAMSEFLVLFDQHAVDERIKLETNLADYFIDNQWKAVNIEEVNLNLSNDDILYLHNFKDKFKQLGLKWTVLNSNTVSIDAIPEAILGKKPRQVEKVIKAVKNLIAEEINVIKMQGGCVSLYPKSIMDLVFSEACRYAVKFGDNLSMSECVEVLRMLSNCKTPFQCAHGRPVMAVIMDVKLNKLDYKVKINKIMEWKRIQ